MRYVSMRLGTLAALVAAIVLMLPGAPAANAIPAVGDRLPTVRLPVPGDTDREYLGIARGKSFTVGNITAPVVVIEFFSMYCPHCQAEAPTTVSLYERLKNDPRLSKRVRLIGIGVGNSAYEVGIFKKKYGIPFPLFEDGDYSILNLVDIRNTPTYIVVGIKNGTPTVVHTQIGRIKDLDAFILLLSSF